MGSTADPEIRLIKHLSNHSGFAPQAKDWKIVFKEEFPDKNLALSRESQLKKWKNRERLTRIIAARENNN
jgi:putative endonuclease